MSWEQAFSEEIEKANLARQSGNEGLARVCARRAANVVIQEYLRSLGVQPYRNAIQNFRQLQRHLSDNHPAQEVLEHMMQKVNYDFTFPSQIDLIKDAYYLRDTLLS